MTHPFFCCVIRYTAIMPSRGSRKNRRAYRLRWFRLRWWREARALPRPSRSLQAWACGSRVAFDAQFGVNDFELRLDGHFSVEKARTWWPNHGKYLDNGRKLILLHAFSPVIGDFPRGSVVTEAYSRKGACIGTILQTSKNKTTT